MGETLTVSDSTSSSTSAWVQSVPTFSHFGVFLQRFLNPGELFFSRCSSTKVLVWSLYFGVQIPSFESDWCTFMYGLFTPLCSVFRCNGGMSIFYHIFIYFYSIRNEIQLNSQGAGSLSGLILKQNVSVGFHLAIPKKTGHANGIVSVAWSTQVIIVLCATLHSRQSKPGIISEIPKGRRITCDMCVFTATKNILRTKNPLALKKWCHFGGAC